MLIVRQFRQFLRYHSAVTAANGARASLGSGPTRQTPLATAPRPREGAAKSVSTSRPRWVNDGKDRSNYCILRLSESMQKSLLPGDMIERLGVRGSTERGLALGRGVDGRSPTDPYMRHCPESNAIPCRCRSQVGRRSYAARLARKILPAGAERLRRSRGGFAAKTSVGARRRARLAAGRELKGETWNGLGGRGLS